MRSPLWFFAILLSLAISPTASAQDLARQPTAFTAWLDFHSQARELPIWIERVETQNIKADAGQPAKTVYRIRFRRFTGLVDEVLLRVYFDDTPGGQPILSAWSEIGNGCSSPKRWARGWGSLHPRR